MCFCVITPIVFHSATCLGGDAHAARREFLSYCLSLMRAHNSEHLDSLPILDVSALKHVAYVFDALIYYMRSSGSNEASENDILREGLPLPPWNDQVGVHFNRKENKLHKTTNRENALFGNDAAVFKLFLHIRLHNTDI